MENVKKNIGGVLAAFVSPWAIVGWLDGAAEEMENKSRLNLSWVWAGALVKIEDSRGSLKFHFRTLPNIPSVVILYHLLYWPPQPPTTFKQMKGWPKMRWKLFWANPIIQWSLVSNSSLSKTFALGSLESHKFRSSVLSIQRSFSLRLI